MPTVSFTLKAAAIGLLAFTPFMLSAQNAVTKFSSLSVGVGASNPVGAYAGTGGPLQNGYARQGGVFALDFAHYKQPLGYAISLSLANHKLNENALNADLNQTVRYTDSSRWMASCLMGGPTYHVSCGRFFAEGHILGGFFFGKAPDVATNDISLKEDFYKFNNNWYDCIGTLGYQAGASAHYQVCPKMSVFVRTNYYHAKADYVIKTRYTSESGLDQKEFKFSQRTSVVDVVFGLGWWPKGFTGNKGGVKY